MKPKRGFTLLELMVVVAIVSIVAALGVAGMRSRQPSAALTTTVLELQTKLGWLRAKALNEQRDHLLILVDGDGSGCSVLNQPGCARYFIVADPAVTWALTAFNPSQPGLDTAEVVESDYYNHVFLNPSVAGRLGPSPFGSVQVFDPQYTATCYGAKCVAFRFKGNGEVWGELVAAGTQKKGNAVAFVTDVELQGGTGARSIVLLGFPSGIVKTYSY